MPIIESAVQFDRSNESIEFEENALSPIEKSALQLYKSKFEILLPSNA